MDEQTLTALKGSIAKWEAIVAGTGQDQGWINCPLCLLFYNANDMERNADCYGCPVSDAVEQQGCNETPYESWAALFKRKEPKIATTEAQKAAAQAELDFLRSLLPVEAIADTSAQRAP